MSEPTVADYAAFLPESRRAAADCAPESAWWEWHGHRVHVLRRTHAGGPAVKAAAPVRVLLVHGAGGHSAALWPLASLLPRDRFDLAAVDLPLYGRTESPHPEAVRYEDWIDLLCAFVRAEDDGRPLILLGASIGGMIAYEVAARTGRAAAVVATCLLDPQDPRARTVMTRFGPFGALGGLLAGFLPKRLGTVRIPMSAVAALSRMSRDPGLSALCAADRRGGGARVPLDFLASFLRYRHARPESMATPVTLAHPSHDAWTPVDVSTRWLRRLAHPAGTVLLRECGHFPVEEPGIGDLIDAVERVGDAVLRRRESGMYSAGHNPRRSPGE